MTSEEKKPKRKYGQNWAKLSNSQADVSAVYQKLVGTLPILAQSEESSNSLEETQEKIKQDQTKDHLTNENTTEDNMTLGSLSVGSELPQGQNDTKDKMSLVSKKITNSLDNFPVTEIHSVKPILLQQTKSSDSQSNLTKENNFESVISPKDLLTPGTISPWSETESNYLKVPNFIIDNLMKTLDSSEFTVYLRLYRLSHGFRQNYCMVGYTSLSEACNLSTRQIRRIIPSLVSRNLIKVVEIYNQANKQGTLYEVYSPDKTITNKQTSHLQHYGQNVPRDTMTTNKSGDHDDLKRQDHHQSEHEKSVMMIYQTVTQNSWTKADIATYQKIKNVPIDKIEIAIRLATQRASSRPNSLAFFTKEILSVSSPKTNRSKQKKAMQKIIDQIKNSKIGSSYSISDLSYWVKEACLRNDITYDTDLFDELMTY